MREETLELRDALRAVRRGWVWVLGGTAIGLLLALVLSLVLPPRFEARSLILVRSASERSTITLPGMGGLGSLLPRGAMQSALDTEIELLTSRTGVEAVIDSLKLQARVTRPRGVAPIQLFSRLDLDPEIIRATYTFRRDGEGFRVEGPGATGRAVPGSPLRIGVGVVTLRDAVLPDEFRVRFVDRDESIRQLRNALDVSNPGGDVAELVYRAGDPRTAAAVPNALVGFYMERRATSDRGVNQRRYEFLLERADSVQTQLAAAEDERRRYQETIGRFDPVLYAEADLQRVTALRSELEMLDMEAEALGRLVRAGAVGGVSPRDLAAYPTFLRNPAVNDLLSRLLEQEHERLELLERRTETDPDVVAMDQRILQLEAQLVSLSSAYLGGIAVQQEELRRQLGGYQAALAIVPGLAQSAQRLYRDIERLSEMSVVLHAQLLEARLDAIGEGGDVRQIDPAVAPLRPRFPKLWLNLVIGMFGGLVLGMVGAAARFVAGEQVEDTRDAALAAGVPALLFRPGSPLLLAHSGERRGVLVLPIGRGAASERVAEHIAATAALQGRKVALADLDNHSDRAGPAETRATSENTSPVEPKPGALVPSTDESNGYVVYRGRGRDGVTPTELHAAMAVLEDRFSLVVVSLPPMDHPYTTALLQADRSVVLAARIGSVTRTELRETVDALERAGIATAGVVLEKRSSNGKSQH